MSVHMQVLNRHLIYKNNLCVCVRHTLLSKSFLEAELRTSGICMLASTLRRCLGVLGVVGRGGAPYCLCLWAAGFTWESSASLGLRDNTHTQGFYFIQKHKLLWLLPTNNQSVTFRLDSLNPGSSKKKSVRLWGSAAFFAWSKYFSFNVKLNYWNHNLGSQYSYHMIRIIIIYL